MRTLHTKTEKQKRSIWKLAAPALVVGAAVGGEAAAPLADDLATAIEMALTESSLDAVWQVGTPVPGVAGAWQAPNCENGLRTFFTENGIRVRPLSADETWGLDLTLAELARGSARGPVSAPSSP